MALPIKKPAPVIKNADYTDDYKVTYLGGEATVRVAVDVKLSINYQSAGISGAIQFNTPASQVKDAIKNATTKLKAILSVEIAKVSEALEKNFEDGL